jgi:hypothetical protein
MVYASPLCSLRPCLWNGASRVIDCEAIGGPGGWQKFAGVGRVRTVACLDSLWVTTLISEIFRP